MKHLLITLCLFALTATFSQADIMHGGHQSGTFRGTITAIESGRDSFTVQSAENQVKMFQVSPSQKSQLRVGQQVTVGYIDTYEWPLQTTSISVSGYNK